MAAFNQIATYSNKIKRKAWHSRMLSRARSQTYAIGTDIPVRWNFGIIIPDR